MIGMPPRGESNSSAPIEEAGKRARDMAKTLRDMIEHKTKEKVKQTQYLCSG